MIYHPSAIWLVDIWQTLINLIQKVDNIISVKNEIEKGGGSVSWIMVNGGCSVNVGYKQSS